MLLTTIILVLSVVILSTPYTIKGSSLQVSLVAGCLLGLHYDAEEFEDEKETDHTFQLALLFVLFTVTYTSKDGE